MKHLVAYIANFAAIILLLVIITLPFYFARHMSKVAGIKSTVPYLITSQIEKFPNVSLTQQGQIYQISYTKLSPSQEFQELLILTNPTSSTQTYRILNISGRSRVFFGKVVKNQTAQISLPSGSSVPISLFSDSQDQTFSAAFQIETQ